MRCRSPKLRHSSDRICIEPSQSWKHRRILLIFKREIKKLFIDKIGLGGPEKGRLKTYLFLSNRVVELPAFNLSISKSILFRLFLQKQMVRRIPKIKIIPNNEKIRISFSLSSNGIKLFLVVVTMVVETLVETSVVVFFSVKVWISGLTTSEFTS